MPTMNTSAQPVALITGAGSGVGRDTALLLAESGYAVALVGRTQAKLQDTADAIRDEVSAEAAVLIQPCDLCEPAALKPLAETVGQHFGRIDALVNNAGIAPLKPFTDTTEADFDACLATNLKGPYFLAQACWPWMVQQNAGVIVNVSSMASVDPFTGFSAYAAAKAGLNLMGKALADEGQAHHIRVVAVAPGAVETPLLRSMFNENMLPTDKTLDPAIVAGVIRDCITGQRAFEPGEVILLNSP